MLYIVIEYFNAGAAPEIYRRARDKGRQLPPGLEYVDSWVDLDYFRCFQLMRTDDRALFDVLTAEFRAGANRKLTRVPHHINDPAFADAVVTAFHEVRTVWPESIARTS